MSEWWKELRWSATARGWYARTDDMLLFIPEAVYELHLDAYVRSLGLEPKTDTERTQLTEEGRKRRHEAIEAFHTNLEYWRHVKEGIEMYPRYPDEKAKFPLRDHLAYVTHVQEFIEQGQAMSAYRQAMGQADSLLAEQRRQQEIARLLEYVKAGELTLREATNTLDGLMLTHMDVS